jgi:hypothetical protein
MIKIESSFKKYCSKLNTLGRVVQTILNALLANYFTLVSRLTYFSALNMEATYSSETLVDFQRTT